MQTFRDWLLNERADWLDYGYGSPQSRPSPLQDPQTMKWLEVAGRKAKNTIKDDASVNQYTQQVAGDTTAEETQKLKPAIENVLKQNPKRESFENLKAEYDSEVSRNTNFYTRLVDLAIDVVKMIVHVDPIVSWIAKNAISKAIGFVIGFIYKLLKTNKVKPYDAEGKSKPPSVIGTGGYNIPKAKFTPMKYRF